MISLSKLSDTLQASKMTIINHYKKLVKQNKNLVKETKKINNKRFFSNHLAKLIMRTFKVTRAKRSTLENKDVLITKLKDQEALINRLTSDNSAKNSQIDKQDTHIKELSKLLNQQQQLQLSSKRALDTSRKQVKKLQTKIEDVPTHKVNVQPKAADHGFWWKLFH